MQQSGALLDNQPLRGQGLEQDIVLAKNIFERMFRASSSLPAIDIQRAVGSEFSGVIALGLPGLKSMSAKGTDELQRLLERWDLERKWRDILEFLNRLERFVHFTNSVHGLINYVDDKIATFKKDMLALDHQAKSGDLASRFDAIIERQALHQKTKALEGVREDVQGIHNEVHQVQEVPDNKTFSRMIKRFNVIKEQTESIVTPYPKAANDRTRESFNSASHEPDDLYTWMQSYSNAPKPLSQPPTKPFIFGDKDLGAAPKADNDHGDKASKPTEIEPHKNEDEEPPEPV